MNENELLNMQRQYINNTKTEHILKRATRSKICKFAIHICKTETASKIIKLQIHTWQQWYGRKSKLE